jgi:hypothetical protein
MKTVIITNLRTGEIEAVRFNNVETAADYLRLMSGQLSPEKFRVGYSNQSEGVIRCSGISMY